MLVAWRSHSRITLNTNPKIRKHAIEKTPDLIDDDEGEEHGGDDLRAQARRLLATLPARPWKLAASGVSCDLGSMRLRLEGARDGKAEVVAALVALPVVLEQLLEEGKTT